MRFLSFRAGLAGAALMVLAGCSTLSPSPYAPKYETLDSLKKQTLDHVSVGAFNPGDPDAPLNKISLRGSPLRSKNGTFSKYLEEAITQDMKEINVYDPASDLRITGTLLRNDIDVSGFSQGSGVIEVALAIRKGSAVRLQKKYSASTNFESSFMGAVAIPKGQGEYSLLVQALLAKIYADPTFSAALSK